jgi:hypothetical protein
MSHYYTNQQIAFDFAEDHLEQKTKIGYSDHQFVRMNVFNSRTLKKPRVVELEGQECTYRLTSRMSSVHLTIMELIVKLSGKNVIKNISGATTFFFDMSELVKHYPGGTNSAFLIQKIQELGGAIDQNGEKLGTYLQVWGNGDQKSDSEVSYAGGIVIESGYADGLASDFLVIKEEGSNRCLENLKSFKQGSRFKANEFYFYVTFSKAWVNFIRDSKLLKTATLKGVVAAGSIKNARLQLVARFMSGQKPGVTRSFDFLAERLEFAEGLSDKGWSKAKRDFFTAVEAEKEHLDVLGIEWDSARRVFKRVNNEHVSVVENI